MARILPNGHLMCSTTGRAPTRPGRSARQSADMCPDPANPGGARIARPQTRVTEYGLDTATRAHPPPARVELRAGRPLRRVRRQPAATGRRPDLRRLVPGQPGRRHPGAGAGGEPGLAQRREGSWSALRQRLVQLPRRHRPRSRRRPPEGHRSPRPSKTRSSRRATRCGCASGAPTPGAPASTRVTEPWPTVTGSRRQHAGALHGHRHGPRRRRQPETAHRHVPRPEVSLPDTATPA